MTAEEIRRIRKKLGITQAEFAARVGVERATVGRWEVGLLTPSRTAVILMRLLGQKARRRPRR
jgi:DNA-binding transcriptional regulator YiaG